MLKSYTFHLVQLGVLKETLVQLPEFRPGGVTPEQITTMLTAAETKQMDCLTAESNRDADRGELEVAQADAHAAAVAGFAQMKSAYRNVPKSLSPIKRLPTRDKSAAETVIRMQRMTTVWNRLPNPPGETTPFTIGDLDQDGFEALLATLEAKLKLVRAAQGELDQQVADLRDLDEAHVKLVADALSLGRSTYKRGTPERELIDAIPTPANTPVPGVPTINGAEDLGDGSVLLSFYAPHATGFKVFQQAPGASAFTQIAQNVQAGEYEVLNLGVGAHKFKVAGVNSRGTGKVSAVTTFTALAAAA